MAVIQHYLRNTQTNGGTSGIIYDLSTDVTGDTLSVNGSVNSTNYTEVLAWQIDVDNTINGTSFPTSVWVSSLSGTVGYRWRIQRVNSANTVVASSAYSSIFSATGIQTATLSLSTAWAVGDRFRISLEIARTGGHGGVAINVFTQSTASFVDLDLEVASTPVTVNATSLDLTLSINDVSIDTQSIINNTVDVTPLPLIVSINDVSVDAQTIIPISVDVDDLQLVTTINDVSVTNASNVFIDVEPLDLTLTINDVVVDTQTIIPISVDVEPLELTATINDVTVYFGTNVTVDVEPLTLTLLILDPIINPDPSINNAVIFEMPLNDNSDLSTDINVYSKSNYSNTIVPFVEQPQNASWIDLGGGESAIRFVGTTNSNYARISSPFTETAKNLLRDSNSFSFVSKIRFDLPDDLTRNYWFFVIRSLTSGIIGLRIYKDPSNQLIVRINGNNRNLGVVPWELEKFFWLGVTYDGAVIRFYLKSTEFDTPIAFQQFSTANHGNTAIDFTADTELMRFNTEVGGPLNNQGRSGYHLAYSYFSSHTLTANEVEDMMYDTLASPLTVNAIPLELTTTINDVVVDTQTIIPRTVDVDDLQLVTSINDVTVTTLTRVDVSIDTTQLELITSINDVSVTTQTIIPISIDVTPLSLDININDVIVQTTSNVSVNVDSIPLIVNINDVSVNTETIIPRTIDVSELELVSALNDVSVTTETSVNVSVDVSELELVTTINDVSVNTSSNVTVNVEPLPIFVNINNATVQTDDSIPVSVDVTPLEVITTINDVSVTTQTIIPVTVDVDDLQLVVDINDVVVDAQTVIHRVVEVNSLNNVISINDVVVTVTTVIPVNVFVQSLELNITLNNVTISSVGIKYFDGNNWVKGVALRRWNGTEWVSEDILKYYKDGSFIQV